MRHFLFWTVICVSFLAAPRAHARDTNVNALKAAITLNIIRYIDFPADRGTGPIQLCVARNANGFAELKALHRQRINDRAIEFRAVDGGPLPDCHIVVLGAARNTDVLAYRKNGSVVIGDGTGFLGGGGTIGLVQTGKQIRFEVNIKAAKEAGVRISSKLLRLAARVQQ